MTERLNHTDNDSLFSENLGQPKELQIYHNIPFSNYISFLIQEGNL